jgi:hypothetical protein
MISSLSKDTDWHIGLKTKTRTLVAYQKHMSLAKKNIGLRAYVSCFMFQMKITLKLIATQSGVAILISDKGDFKPNLVRRNKKGHLMSI